MGCIGALRELYVRRCLVLLRKRSDAATDVVPASPTPTEAIATAGPTGVDVSSGVCSPDGLKKDLGKVQRYCSAAAAAFRQQAAGDVGAR